MISLRVLYLQLEGLYAGLERTRVPSSGALILVHGGRVVDFCPRARERGVRRDMSASHARRCAPDASVVRFTPDQYGRAELEALPRLAARFSPRVEVVAPEQIFLQLGTREDDRRVASHLARCAPDGMGHRLLIGAAGNRLLSRIAVRAMEEGRKRGEMLPSSGQRVRFLGIPRDGGEQFLRDMPVSFLWPLSGEVRNRLKKLGLNTAKDVTRISGEALAHQFDPITARLLHRYSRGRDSSAVACDYPPAEKVWEGEVRIFSVDSLREALTEAAECLAAELIDEGVGGSTVRLELRGDDDRRCDRERRFPRPIWRTSTLRRTFWALGEKLPRKIFGGGISPVRMRATVSSLVRQRAVQESIFSAAQKSDREEIRRLVRDLNDRYTDRVIFWGEQLPVSYRERRLALWDPVRGRGRTK